MLKWYWQIKNKCQYLSLIFYFLIVALLAFAFSLFSIFIELFFIGIEKKVELEKKRLELNKKIKEQKDPEKMQELFAEMMELNNQLLFDINRLKIMLVTTPLFFFIIFFILPKIPDKPLITIPLLNIGLNPYWCFFALYFIFMFIQNIIVMKLLVKYYGKTSA